MMSDCVGKKCATSLLILSLLLFSAVQAQGESVLEVSPRPMTTAQCGSCHPGQFSDLKARGGGHRLECRQCHLVFHVPQRSDEDFIDQMPRCAGCHGHPHENIELPCFSCHRNAHAPAVPIKNDLLKDTCQKCHPQAAGMLDERSNAHAVMNCDACHTEDHGMIPDCFQCHEPHYLSQKKDQCMNCHHPHRPRSGELPIAADTQSCKSCHSSVYAVWAGTSSRHGDWACSVCHIRHGEALACRDCHDPPHEPAMLEKFKRCTGCHFNPHDPSTTR
jgi:hypothetical protein